MLCRDTLLAEKTLDMGVIFDLCIFIIAAGMMGENLAIGNPYIMRVSEHCHGSRYLRGMRAK